MAMGGARFPPAPDQWIRGAVRLQLDLLAFDDVSDSPGMGEFYRFEEYLEQRIKEPAYDPRGVVLAVSSGVWVGMAVTSLRQDEGCAVSDMTGVLPAYRSRGIALAMKLLAIDFARSGGMRWLVALHHPGNAAVIGLNRRLVSSTTIRVPAALRDHVSVRARRW